MNLSTSSQPSFDMEVDGAEAYTLEENDEFSSSTSMDQDFAVVLLLFIGILIGVCLIGRRRWHD